MYSFIRGYLYRGKRRLSRPVACSAVGEALENILASVTTINAGEIHEDNEDK